MDTMKIEPSPGYLKKMWVIMTIVAVLVAAFGYVMGLLIGIDHGPDVAIIVFLVSLAIDLVWYIPALILAGYYYRSLSYEIQDDEVIVRVGIVTKSIKHVPYRTVTNIKINRGILDRYVFNLGSLNIQTAGMSGTTGAEESLVGLTDVQAVYDTVAAKLRSFRGAMAPTAAESELEPDVGAGATMRAMLDELRAIRKNTEK